MSNSQLAHMGKSTLQKVVCCPGLDSLEKTLRQGFLYMWYFKEMPLGKTGKRVGESRAGKRGYHKRLQSQAKSPESPIQPYSGGEV